MTHTAQTGQRTSLVAAAMVAAAVSGVITVSGLVLAGQIALPDVPGGIAPVTQADGSSTQTYAELSAAQGFSTQDYADQHAAPSEARLEQRMDAERAWEAQRRVQSADAIRHERQLQQLGTEWQLRYEQTNPNR